MIGYYIISVIVIVIVFISIVNAIQGKKGRVAVVVIGDVGRSPRMQYQALSLATQAHLQVDFVGFEGTDCWQELTDNVNIHFHLMKTYEENKSDSWVKQKLMKVFSQFFNLFYILLTIPRPTYVLVQTPPAIPVLFVAHVVCLLRWSRLVIDWHNYGYTILNMTKKDHYSVTIYKWYERIFGRGAYINFCVSKAMQEDLQTNWGIKATVLYDKPPHFYRKATIEETHKLCLKHEFGKADNGESAFTQSKKGKISLLPGRPALLVSSTSWTKDENFDMLIDALEDLEKIIEENKERNFPKVRVVVTGKGDLREHYEKIISKKSFKYVSVFTTFLSYHEYMTLLGSANLGISLHESSSGVDLPMKVVDMFGCGLPVAAVNFRALPELVQHEKNGLVFNSINELSHQIFELFKDFPKVTLQLNIMKKNIKKYQNVRWNQSWKDNALELYS